ncbi:MAG: hypothetical protein K6C97_09945 [Treponema sp.]|nr:hypothetical protein [Treponema sp.]
MRTSKRLAIFFILISGLFSFNTFALGAGVQIGLIPAFDINQDGIKVNDFEANLTGTVKLFRIPAAFGFGMNAGMEDSKFIFGAAGFFDYWVMDLQLKNTWNLYSGFGLYGKFMFNTDSKAQTSIGPRFFLGCNWLFIDNYLEYYAQITAIPTYVRNLSDSRGFFRLNLPFETGLRLHF